MGCSGPGAAAVESSHGSAPTNDVTLLPLPQENRAASVANSASPTSPKHKGAAADTADVGSADQGVGEVQGHSNSGAAAVEVAVPTIPLLLPQLPPESPCGRPSRPCAETSVPAAPSAARADAQAEAQADSQLLKVEPFAVIAAAAEHSAADGIAPTVTELPNGGRVPCKTSRKRKQPQPTLSLPAGAAGAKQAKKGKAKAKACATDPIEEQPEVCTAGRRLSTPTPVQLRPVADPIREQPQVCTTGRRLSPPTPLQLRTVADILCNARAKAHEDYSDRAPVPFTEAQKGRDPLQGETYALNCLDALNSKDLAAVQAALRQWETAPLEVGTGCSGSESPVLALRSLAAALVGKLGIGLAFRHRWSAESAKPKRQWIRQVACPEAHFCDVADLSKWVALNVANSDQVWSCIVLVQFVQLVRQHVARLVLGAFVVPCLPVRSHSLIAANACCVWLSFSVSVPRPAPCSSSQHV